MQSLKWRLSFTAPRPSRQVKRLWNEYVQAAASFKDDTAEVARLRVLIQFLDGCLSCVDTLNKVAMIDELLNDLVIILCLLIDTVCLCSKWMLENPTDSDDRVVFNEGMIKSLSTAELFVTIRGSKACLQDLLQKDDNPCIKAIVETIDQVKNLSQQLTLIRMLKQLVLTEKHLLKLIELRGLNRLHLLAMREEQPALTSLIMHLFCDYFAYGRGYNSKFAEDQKKVPENTDKTVVLAGNYLIDEPRKLIKLPSGNLCVPTVVDDDLHLNSIVDNSSSTNLDGKDKHDNRQNGLAESLSVAFNAVGDLLKLTPLSLAILGEEQSSQTNRADALRANMSAITRENFVVVRALIPLDQLGKTKDEILISRKIDDGEIMGKTVVDSEKDPLNFIRHRLIEQGFIATILHAMQQAITPSEALETLVVLQVALLGNAPVKSLLINAEGTNVLNQMIIRVEENLSLLMPCRMTSFAAASGKLAWRNDSAERSTASDSVGSAVNPLIVEFGINDFLGRKPDELDNQVKYSNSRYYHTAGSEFDSYYSDLLTSILNMLVDGGEIPGNVGYLEGNKSSHNTQNKLAPLALPLGVSLKSTFMTSVTKTLLSSDSISLVAIGVRICYALMQSNPKTVLTLEEFGIDILLLQLLSALTSMEHPVVTKILEEEYADDHDQSSLSSLPNKSDGDTKTSRSSFDFGHNNFNTIKNKLKSVLLLISEILVVLQAIAVAVSERDLSVGSFIGLLSWQCVFGKSDIDVSDTRCQNCETEIAVSECLNAGCVLEKCSRLCTECDKVFHKAASKRHHFRLSLKKLGKEEQNMFQTTKSSLFKCLSKSGREASQYLPVVHDLNAFKGSSSPARIPSSEEDYISSDILKQAFGDHVLILLSASLRGLLDDMKARRQQLFTELYDLCLALLRGVLLTPVKDNTSDYFLDGDVIEYSYSKIFYDVAVGRDDLLGGTTESSTSAYEPPEITRKSPRRLVLSLLLQSIAKYLVIESKMAKVIGCNDDLLLSSSFAIANGIGSNDLLASSSRIHCYRNFMNYGGDLMALHLLIDNSSSTQLTLLDKQYVLWLLREIFIGCSIYYPAASDSVLNCFMLILRADVAEAHDLVKLANSNTRDAKWATSTKENELKETAKVAAKVAGGRISASLAKFPYVSRLLQLMALQEIRVIVVGRDFQRTSTDVDSVAVILSRLTTNFYAKDDLSSRSASFDTSYKEEERQPAPVGDNESMMFNTFENSDSAKSILIAKDLISILKSMLFETGCGASIVEIIQYSPSKFKSNSSCELSDLKFSEVEVEQWWSALLTLIQLVSGSDKAKIALNDVIGMENFVRFLLFLSNTVKKLREQSLMGEIQGVVNVLLSAIIECCVGGDRFLPPSPPFSFAKASLPSVVSAHLHVEESRNLNNSMEFYSTMGPALMLFLRPALSVSFSNGMDHDFPETELLQNGKLGATIIAPLYFMHSHLPKLVGNTYSSKTLRLSTATLRNSFRRREGFAPFGSRSPNQSTGALKPPAVATRFSSKGSLAEDLSSTSLFSVNQSLPKKMISRTVSQASLQGSDFDNKWEIDSLGRSSTHGDGSLAAGKNSNHSLLALSLAINSANHTPTPSVNGDSCGALSSYLLYSNAREDEETKPLRGTSTQWADSLSETFDPLIYGLDDTENLKAFPQLYGSVESGMPVNYFQIMLRDQLGVNSEILSRILVLVHHSMLVRSGLSSEIFRNSVSEGEGISCNVLDSLIEEHKIEAAVCNDIKVETNIVLHEIDLNKLYRQIVRKHLTMLLHPVYFSRNKYTGDIPWRPSFARLVLRSVESGEMLLSAALALDNESQAFLLSTLSYLMDGNPANSFKMCSQPKFHSKLITMIETLREGSREACGYILSQLLRYTSSTGSLLALVSGIVRNSRVDVNEEIDENESVVQSLLFVVGRVAERMTPPSFLQFPHKSPSSSCIRVTSTEITRAINGINFAMWVRIGTLNSYPVASLLSCSTGENNIEINVFFRVIHRLNHFQRDNDGSSVISGMSNMPGDFMQANETSRKIIQLCISYKNQLSSQNDLNPSFVVKEKVLNGTKKKRSRSKEELKTLADEESVKHVDLQSGKAKGNKPEDFYNAQAMEGVDKKRKKNSELDCKKHWNYALATVSGNEDIDSQENSKLLGITTKLTQHIVPDAIIDYDWSELGDWHLVAIHFTENLLVCSIDGKEVPISYWTPFGYRCNQPHESQEQVPGDSNYQRFSSPSSPFTNVRRCEQDEDFKLPSTQLFEEFGYKIQKPSLQFDEISRDNPLNILIGGWNSKSDHDVGSLPPNTKTANLFDSLIHCVDTTLGGMCGTIGSVVVTEETVPLDCLSRIFQNGPATDLIELLDSLVGMKKLGTVSMKDLSPKQWQVASATHYISSADGRQSVSSAGVSKKESVESYLVHHTTSLMKVLGQLGGIKVFYPLLIMSKPQTIAALRIISSIVGNSQNTSNEDSLECVLLYCCYKNPSIISLEIVQILFDLALSGNRAKSSVESRDSISRPAVLELLCDLSLLLATNVQIPRSVVDWLREICDESVNNCHRVLKSLGILPLLLILSSDALQNTDLAIYLSSKNSRIPDSNKEVESVKPEVGTKTTIKTQQGASEHSKYRVVDVTHLSCKAGQENDETATVQIDFINKYKLQLACSRMLKLIITGTSGDINSSTMQNFTTSATVTGFCATQVSTLIGFVVTCIARSSEDPNVRFRPTDRRIKAFMSSLSGVTILTTLDFTSSGYWLLSSTTVILDVLLEIANGKYESMLVGMLRTALPGNGLWYTVLYLMGSGSVEVRERALRLLILTLSTSSGKLDSRQTASFTKCNGFKIMAEQLSSHTNSASELVLEALLDLVYWKRRGKMKYSSESSISSKVQQFDSPLRATPLSTRSEAPEAAKYGYLASLHGPEIVQSLESHRNNSAVDKEETTSLSAIERTPDPVIRQDMQTTVSYPNSAGESELSLTTDASTTSGNASNSSSLMSLFSWGNRSVSTKPISLVEKLESIPELSVSPKLVQDGGFVEDFRTLSYTSAVSEESHSRGQFKAIDSDILASPIHKAVVEAEESGSNVVEFEQILLPQVIEAVVKVLYKSTSPQQVKYFFSILENSITIATQTESLEHLLSHFQNANLSEKLVKECNDQAYRNAEAIFQQRDWLLLFTDMLSYFRRKLLNAEDSDTGGQLAPSDNESVGDLGIGREYVISPRYNTSADGDDSFVGSTPQLFDKAASNSFFNSSYRARPTSVSSVSEHSSRNIQSWISPFTQPVLSLTRRLLLLDMGNKVSASRRYQELFRLSSPETYDIQEIIVLDLLTGLESFKPSKTNVDVLRNIAVMLEQFLDKGELSLLANMRAVKTLHLLTYNCPLDVRQYLKNETNLTEIRKSYVCRCVIDTSQELYLRVIALSEIISPLKEYLMSTDSQLLSAKSIVLIILSMFIDVFEDLEFLFTATDTDEFFDSLLTRQGILESNTGNTTYDRLQMSTEMMHAVIVLVQSCSETSVECRKVLIRICSELKGDPELLVLEALTNSFGKMNTQEIQESAISSTAMAYASPVPPVSKGSEASSQPASSSWWGVWSSYTEPAMEGENKEVLKSDINNTEKRKSEKKLDSATTPDIEMGDSVSADSQSVSADEPVIECASSNHAERPNTVLSFISWFCNIKQSQLQKEFRAKLLKEIKPALSQADKLRDRSSQKFSRFSRGVQERRNKEKQTNSKLVADSTAAMHRACEKIQQQFERDIQKWSIDREERVSTGKQSFETGLNEINQRIKGDQDKNDISRTFLLSEKLQMYLSGKSEPMNIVNTSNTTDGLSAEKVTSIGCAHDASSTKPGISSVEAFQELLQFFKSDA